MKNILFLDGKFGKYEVHLVEGACLVGDPTAFVIRKGERVYVSPGQSVEFVETIIHP